MKQQPRYQPGDRIGGRYQVHKALLGGMGEVYLCLDLEEMLPLALKTFQQRYQSSALRKAFEQEVATWVALERHPNIVTCSFMNIFDNQPFMILEWIIGEEGQGADLRGWLRRGPLGLRMALEMIIDVTRGLIHAQEKQPGLVHRDLKPENILVTQGRLAKITDFGLAQIVERVGLETTESEGPHSFVKKGGIAGTPEYMAPEQWQGKPLNERTDIYALGCILYEMLTGTQPFPRQRFKHGLSAIQAQHENAPPPSLPTALPRAVNELISDCMAKTPDRRPASLVALLTRAESLYKQQFANAARPVLSPVQFTAVAYNNRAGTYSHLRQYEAALADCKKAIELDPHFALTYINQGLTYHRLQQYKAALSSLSRAIQLDPNLAMAYSNRGATYAALQQYELALADYEKAIELDPNFINAYVNRGDTYATLQQYDIALIDYKQALELDPNYTMAHSNRATIYAELQQYEAALADCRRAIELDPYFAHGYAIRGVTYAKSQQYEAALTDLNRAIELDPLYAEAYSNRGNTYAALQQREAALADFNRAIELNPNYSGAYSNRGLVYSKLEQYEAALADFNRAIELAPTDAGIYANRGNAYADLQQYQAALADYEQAIALNPAFAAAYSNRGIVYKDLQQYDAALADYQQAIALDPTDASAYYNLGLLLVITNQLTASLSYFEQAGQLGADQAYQAIAQVRQMLGKAAPTSHPEPTPDDFERAVFEAFPQVDSLAEMKQAVTTYPFMTQADCIAVIERLITQLSPEHQPYFEQRLGWLKQIAQEQNP